MRELNTVCVFCGSTPGSEPEYAEAARGVGRLLAAEGTGWSMAGPRSG